MQELDAKFRAIARILAARGAALARTEPPQLEVGSHIDQCADMSLAYRSRRSPVLSLHGVAASSQSLATEIGHGVLCKVWYNY